MVRVQATYYLLISSPVTPISKSGDTSLMTNYGTISALPFFSKMLERIKYNRLYTCLTEKNLLYWKQLLFQNDHSPEYAGLQVSSGS